MLIRDDNEEGHSMRGNSSQDNEIRNMPEIGNNVNLSRDLDMLSGEINFQIGRLTIPLTSRTNFDHSPISKITIPTIWIRTTIRNLIGTVNCMTNNVQFHYNLSGQNDNLGQDEPINDNALTNVLLHL